MAPSLGSTDDDSPLVVDSDDADHTLQPFFVLHKAHPQGIQEKVSRSGRGRKKTISSSPKSPEKFKRIQSEEPLSDSVLEQLRLDAFDKTWSKIQSTIKRVLRDINLELFDDVLLWVEESFQDTKSNSKLSFSEIQKPYPFITDTLCRKIPTSFILTKNAEYVDDIQTFTDLGLHLKSNGCHVANISALDFSTKHGISGSLKSLLRQLHSEPIDVAVMMVLAKWYCEETNYNKPIIIMIDDLERCNGSILGDFISMISEWVMKMPIYLIMGVATTMEASKKILSSNCIQCLDPCKFNSGSPRQKMNSLVESVLLRLDSCFGVSYKVASFLRNYFLCHDGTVTSFITALKIVCSKHFQLEPLSFLCLSMLDDKDLEEYWHEKFDLLPEYLQTDAFDLPSCKTENNLQKNGSNIIQGLSDLKSMQKDWTSVTLCLFEVANHGEIQLLDLFCEALEPEINGIKISENNSNNLDKYVRKNSGSIFQTIHLLREMPLVSLSNVLAKWDFHTKEMSEINEKVKELQSLLSSTDERQIYKENLPNIRSRRAQSLGAGKLTSSISLNDKAAMLLDTMLRKYMVPIECIPFHEIICFRDVDLLQSALIGDPRRTIQVDLLKSQTYISCSCCISNGISLSSSMHDTSIMYNLIQEYGDVINLHDWYQSFKSIMNSNGYSENTPKKKKSRLSSPSKKQKTMNSADSEASIQARYCRAVTELQITGLIRMPSKRRPDFVQRIAFGL